MKYIPFEPYSIYKHQYGAPGSETADWYLITHFYNEEKGKFHVTKLVIDLSAKRFLKGYNTYLIDPTGWIKISKETLLKELEPILMKYDSGLEGE